MSHESLPICTQCIISNSVSWSGPFDNRPKSRGVSEPGTNYQTRRSWARSKRISLGCLEWRSANSMPMRSSHSKSVKHGNSISYKEGGLQAFSESMQRAQSVPVQEQRSAVQEPKSGYSRARAGADALLRRLRMRSGAKGRSKTPGPSDLTHTNDCPPVRSLSTPRSCSMSKSYTDWTNPDSQVYSNYLHAQCFNSKGESILSLKSAPDIVEHSSAVCSVPCASSQQQIETSPIRMLRITPHSAVSPVQTQIYGSSASCCGHHPPSEICSPNQRLACRTLPNSHTTGEFLPVCYIVQRPLSHLEPGGHSSTNPLYLGNATSRNIPDNNPIQIYVPRSSINPTFLPSVKNELLQPVLRSPALELVTVPESVDMSTRSEGNDPSAKAGMKQVKSEECYNSMPQTHRHIPSSRTTDALHSLNADQTYGDPRITISHMDVAAIPGSPRSNPLYSTAAVYTRSELQTPRPAGNEYNSVCMMNEPKSSDATDPPPGETEPVREANAPEILGSINALLADLQNTEGDSERMICQNTLTVRPDSLLSASSLTGDSSLSDSIPNSSSSRDSALGGNTMHSQRMAGNSKELISSTLETSYHTRNYPTSETQGISNATSHAKIHSTMNSGHRLNHGSMPTPELPKTCDHVLPPTPRRHIWSTKIDELRVSPHGCSNVTPRSRVERRNVAYVNAGIYQPPEGQQTRYSKQMLGRLSPPTSWAHLLPYRASTVPQNLSDRLKKSETLPNDVWIQAQRPNETTNPEQRTTLVTDDDRTPKQRPSRIQAAIMAHTAAAANMHSESRQTDGGMYQMKAPRSPPPPPPVRTSSNIVSGHCRAPTEKFSEINPLFDSAENSAFRSPATGARPAAVDEYDRGQCDPNFPLMFDAQIFNDQVDGSPVLCRYSQLYSLNLRTNNTKDCGQTNTGHHHPSKEMKSCPARAHSSAAVNLKDLNFHRLDLNGSKT
ncbi:unnamed protein product [Calicophoron daubneyi]|uniref:Uncharacterized protein n=1 Tax=Calicophoron daubneyi TaxID=300641 RepID=A0AAV2THQ8_CALDB